MKDRRLGWILSVALCLGFVAVEARGDGASRAEFFAQLQREAADQPSARRPAKPSGVTGEKGYCSADCGGGTSVYVNCGGTCTATDRNCSAGQRGYAQCTGGSKVYCPSPCPPPPDCFVETPCPSGGSVWCWGSDPYSCSGGPGYCFAMCDGVATWCPGETGFLC